MELLSWFFSVSVGILHFLLHVKEGTREKSLRLKFSHDEGSCGYVLCDFFCVSWPSHALHSFGIRSKTVVLWLHCTRKLALEVV